MSIPVSIDPLGTLGSGLPPLPAGWRHVESVVLPREETPRTIFNRTGVYADYKSPDGVYLYLKADVIDYAAGAWASEPSIVLGNFYTGGESIGAWVCYYNSGTWPGVEVDNHYTENFGAEPCSVECELADNVYKVIKDGVVKKTGDVSGKVARGRYWRFCCATHQYFGVRLYRCVYDAPFRKNAFYPVENTTTGASGIYELESKTVYPI